MILNYQLHHHETSTVSPMIFIHGLFGSLSNLGVLARNFSEQRTVIQIDVRNHGLSGHSSDINYQLMAEDVLETLSSLNVHKFVVVGHSMGGKIAMKLADLAREQTEKLIVLDITPIQYHESHHAEIFKALFAVQQANVASRLEAAKIMRKYLHEEMVIQFLLKSFNKGQWLFNVQALFDHYPDIMAWEKVEKINRPALFLRGGDSFYISKPEHFAAINEQFSQAKIEVIENTGHWLHGEKPDEVIKYMQAFVN
ncbi:alpha/beta fold hydrolase [Acinetobacter pseudolwoffii]|uniref:alpha/beta fold hydrolase n=1 Tax=Acinetobacter pseudolwoffii TaxID=2053287 RepID=UPI00209B50D7|nr:alpha/beta fold hydrolase [Acinetobacter pseudolwoffii]MCO8090777.1 alpha/beta fold hydrolase [Acinetobacter pseudolwoffii]MDM1337026.1 alpha/beta fold hydrolase [Acinetobacter pseudolwoffii]